MSGITVLAIDDEELALNDLIRLLSQADEIGEVLSAKTSTQALQVLADRRDIDALFLDIQMPGLNGIELARVLKNYKNPPAIAFVTAHDSYAVDAFELQACDYLLKPVDQSRLDQAIRRVVRESGDSGGASKDSFAKLTCRRGSKTFTIDRDEVSVVEAAGDLVRVHTIEGESHLVRESISSLTAAWSSCGFLRIHRSYLIRASSIVRVRSEGGARSVEVDGRDLPVSRRYTRLLEDYFSRDD